MAVPMRGGGGRQLAKAAATRRHWTCNATICSDRDEGSSREELECGAWPDNGVIPGSAEMSCTTKTASAAVSQDDHRRIWAVIAVTGRSLSSDAPRTWAMLRSPEMKGPCLTCHDSLHAVRRHCCRSGISLPAKCRLHRAAAPGCFQVLAHGVIDSFSMQWQTQEPNHSVVRRQRRLPGPGCHPCVHQTCTLSTVHQWPAKISAVVSPWTLGGRMKAGSEMTGARLGVCFENALRRRSRHRILKSAYASGQPKSSFWVRGCLGFFCVAKHVKRPKRWPPAVCFTGVCVCNAAHRSLWQVRPPVPTKQRAHTVRSARLSLLHALHPSSSRPAGHLIQARVMTLFGLSTADPRGRGGLIEDPPSSLQRDFETMWQPHAAKQTGVWKLSLCARVHSEHPAPSALRRRPLLSEPPTDGRRCTMPYWTEQGFEKIRSQCGPKLFAVGSSSQIVHCTRYTLQPAC
jgi:hypothetical protein